MGGKSKGWTEPLRETMNSFQILPVLDTGVLSEEEGYQHGLLPRAWAGTKPSLRIGLPEAAVPGRL